MMLMKIIIINKKIKRLFIYPTGFFVHCENYITRVAKLRIASRMLIHFKLDYQGAWPPLIYKNTHVSITNVWLKFQLNQFSSFSFNQLQTKINLIFIYINRLLEH